MERDDGDGDIQTRSTSRSNSIDEGETNSTSPVTSINQAELSSPEDVNEQVQTMPDTQLTLTSNSSSDFETDFVAINKSDLDPDANNAPRSVESSCNAAVTDVHTDKSYQPIFGSFLFSDSDPLSRAAFVASSSPSSEVETTQERLMDSCAVRDENDTSNNNQLAPSLPTPLESTENIDDDNDEDDFDGIPIRHASITTQKKFNGDSDSMVNQSNHDNLFDEFINHVENAHDDYDLEDDSFLNGFTDEQHDTTAVVPSLFKDIPDIDDPYEHEEDNNDRVPFDHMDMYNQSDSIRSSSPDSLLSSSHLQDEQDDDVNFDDEVTQWNDDNILHSNSSNINSQTNRTNLPLILQMHPFDQVNFIDSSRSNSRCSNVSSHLSFGYTDQARVFISDDGLVTSSDSDANDNSDDDMNLDSNTLNRNDNEELCLKVNDGDDNNNNEELCLQVNLDDHRSVSSYSKGNSTRSASPASNETPIVDIDEDNDENNDESKTLQIAPIAAMDDEDEDDIQTCQSDQPVLPTITPNIKNFLELRTEQRQNEIVHDIINMRHLLNENNHDDEFIAIMHNPRIFEDVLYDHDNNNNNNDDDDEEKSNLVKQTNSVTCNFRSSSQLPIDNKIKNESFEHHQNIQQASSSSSLLESNNEKTPSSPLFSSHTTTTIRNNSSSTAADYLTPDDDERKKNGASVNVVNTTNILNIKQQKEQLQCEQTNTSNIDSKQFTNVEEHNRIMSTDNESDDDLELLKTLSQLHDIVNTTQSTEKINRVEHQISSDSSSINQDQNSLEYSHENIITNGNEAELLNKKSRQNTHIILPTSPYVTDTIKNSDEEQEEKDEKKNIIFHKNHNDDDDGDDKQKEKYEYREEEKKTTTFFSLTSTSPTLFNNDSHSTVVVVDPDTPSLLPNLLLLSSNKLNDSLLLSNQLITDDSQITNTKSNMDNLSDDDRNQQKTATDLFDPFSPTTTKTKAEFFDSIFTDSKDDDVNEFKMPSTVLPSNTMSTQPLGNYSFDDLWNQSMSQIESSNNPEIKSDNNFDQNPFSWDAFLNNDTKNEKLNPFDDDTTVPTSNTITWESLFGEEKQEKEDDENDLKDFLYWIISHLDDSEEFDIQPKITFTSTQNLESIVKEIQMCLMPFEPIPSPPLHIDHSVSNPMINAIHHELFPINELEQLNATQEQQSMILYEEDEDENEKENDEIVPVNNELNLVAETLVSNIIQLALDQVNESYNQIEHFVDQILAQAVFDVYNEDYNLSILENNDLIPIENLVTIINWHNSIKTTNKNLLDSLDQKVDNVSNDHLQTPNHITNENLVVNQNKTDVDPWLLTTIEHNNDFDPIAFFSNTLDESDLFSSTSNPTNKIPEFEDDEAGNLSEYVPPPILRDPTNPTMVANNLMKYTLTAPVFDDSGDDSSFQEDYFMSHKNESSVETNNKFDEEPAKTKDITSTDENEVEIDAHNNIFSQKGHSLQFEAFASDQPLDSSDNELKFANITAQFNEFDESSQLQQSTDDNTPWITIDKTPETVQTSSISKDEPWELEDSGEENIAPGFPTTTPYSDAFNDNEFSTTEKTNLPTNYFSDSFNAPITTEKHPSDDKENYDDYFTKQQLNENTEQSLAKSAHFDDNQKNVQASTSLKDNLNASESSTTSDSDIVEVNEIAPTFETISDHMQTSYVNVDETDVKIELPNELIERTPHMVTVESESEDLPPPLPPLPPLNNKSSMCFK
ncbi:unnamed protein product [Rotaria sp. Silwood2]|nr:unnamed protein product [Rotaria sp. Silwood2]